MGLGSRSASRHETVGASKAAGVDPSVYWDHQPGDKVMTVDGFPGVVASVEDGPLAGTEQYQVTLDGGLGGGSYTGSQLRALTAATAAQSQAATTHTAADDYPELAQILVDRPDIAPNQVMGAKTAAWPGEYGDYSGDHGQCPTCGEMVDLRHQTMADHSDNEHGTNQYEASAGYEHKGPFNVAVPEGLEPNDGAEPGVDEHGHLTWDGSSPGCRDTDEYSMFGMNDAVKQAAFYTEDEVRALGQAEEARQGKSAEEILRAQASWKDEYTPEELAAPCRDHHPDPADDGTHSVGDHYEHYERTGRDAWGRPKMQPYDGHDAWSCNNYECTEHPQHMYDTDQGENPHLQKTPGWLSHDSSPDADLRRMVDSAMPRQDTEDANWLLSQQHQGPSHLSSADHNHQSMDELLGCRSCGEKIDHLSPPKLLPQDHGEHGPWNLHGQCKKCGYAPHTEADDECDDEYCQRTGFEDGWHTKGEHIDPDHSNPFSDKYQDAERAVRDAFGGEDHGWLLDQQHQGPSHLSSKFFDTVKDTYETLRGEQAPVNPCYAYAGHHHPAGETCQCFTGGPRPQRDEVHQPVFAATDPWRMIAEASADPDFRFHVTAAWADVRNKAKRLRAEGRVHVTAYTDGMLHGEVKGDHHVYETGLQRLPGKAAVTSWSCGCKWGAYHWGADDDMSRFAGRMCSHALALQFEAQSRGMFGRDIVADDIKPAWVPRRVVVKYDIDEGRNVSAPATRVASLGTVTPAGSLLRRTADLQAVAMAFAAAGIDLEQVLRAESAVNDAWGEPVPAAPQYGPGPTKPRDPGENPASAGWASAGDPDSWDNAGPSGLNHMVAAHGGMDDAIFEPEMPKEAFLPLLIPLAEGIAGAAAGAGAAEVGAGLASGVARGVGTEVVKKMLTPGEHSQPHPDAPSGPQGPGDPTDDDEKNPLNYGARADLHEAPEPALPSTDGDSLFGLDAGDPTDAEPQNLGFASTGSLDDVVAQFQATAGARALQGGGSGPVATARGEGGGDLDVAAAARAFLATGVMPEDPAKGGLQATALKNFTPAEQAAIINEGEHVRHANVDRLDLRGTHYEHAEAALAASDDDESWMA